MTVILWPIGKIRPYARNARKIPQKAIDKVAASIQSLASDSRLSSTARVSSCAATPGYSRHSSLV
jgi:hypothetical protein